ncbi:MAG: hypothetical protein IT267_08565 [Saprospiraceae bacterium]|nr:hypothetical protein [Saprospiraceae bacterium]
MVLLFSCQKELNVDFVEYQTGTVNDINAIVCKNPEEIFIGGGVSWFHTDALWTEDGGKSWSSMDLSGRSIQSMCCDVHDHIFACGIDKKLYIMNSQKPEELSFGDYIFFRAIDAWSPDNILLAGGESFRVGYIYKASILKDTLFEVLNTQREMNSIHCIDSLNWVASGFGIVLKTQNGGMNWDTINITGDHFRDMYFINDSIGYMCGIGGDILKTSNRGLAWRKLRDAQKLLVGFKPFRCICFKNEMEGIVAGESGIVWMTSDGGNNWVELQNVPFVNYYDVQFDSEKYWLSGSGGTLISIQL